MTNFRRLAVFVDRPSDGHYLWILLESAEDPAVWTDVETCSQGYSSWIEAYDAGTVALFRHVDNELIGPIRHGTNTL